ncbi:TolC family protein, partial [Salmonella enterica]|uniref:TolC family protein n=1 Tax=Salmonella enterica TaxID=28901 RepID=UPI003297D4A2
ARAADSPAPAGELTLADAVGLALERNPDLVASRYELTASQARIVQAGLRPNPELGVEYENFAGSGTVRSVDA